MCIRQPGIELDCLLEFSGGMQIVLAARVKHAQSHVSFRQPGIKSDGSFQQLLDLLRVTGFIRNFIGLPQIGCVIKLGFRGLRIVDRVSLEAGCHL
jgi:hypothetical protein